MAFTSEGVCHDPSASVRAGEESCRSSQSRATAFSRQDLPEFANRHPRKDTRALEMPDASRTPGLVCSKKAHIDAEDPRMRVKRVKKRV
jgi:hypothetical protein